MEILMSANEKILFLSQYDYTNISFDMTEQDFLQWIKEIEEEGKNDGNTIQEVPV